MVLARGVAEWIQYKKTGVEWGLQLSRKEGCSEGKHVVT